MLLWGKSHNWLVGNSFQLRSIVEKKGRVDMSLQLAKMSGSRVGFLRRGSITATFCFFALPTELNTDPNYSYFKGLWYIP